MARGPKYRVAFRRRREAKTNYYRRKQMVLSENPRAMIRGSLNNISVQIANMELIGDKIIVSAHSSELVKIGWVYHTGNLPSAYLVGYLAGIRAVNNKSSIKKTIPDLGVFKNTPKARIYAALKGLIDAGVSTPCDAENFPSEDRIRGEHIAEYVTFLKEKDPDAYKRQYSAQIKNKANLSKISQSFEAVKATIESTKGELSTPVPKKAAPKAKPKPKPKSKPKSAPKKTTAKKPKSA